MRKIAILLASADISGGVAVILEHARGLADKGCEVILIAKVVHAAQEFTWHPAHSLIANDQIRLKTFAEAQDDHFDAAIATYWRTVFDLHRVSATKYLYFVQSIESRFAREEELTLRLAIDGTYELGLGIVTIASWMVEWLDRVHGVEAVLARNGLNKAVFTTDGPVIARNHPADIRVLVEGPTDVPFKNVPNTVAACAAANPDELWLLTTSDVSSFPNAQRVFSRLSMQRASEVYRSVDVLVKLSFVEGMFGPPLEMFACGGTCIVFDVTGYDEYIKHGENALVVPAGDYIQVTRWVRILSSNGELMDHLRRGAAETARQWPTWSESSSRFYRAICEAAEKSCVSRIELRRRSQRIWALFNASLGLSPAMRPETSQREVPATQMLPR